MELDYFLFLSNHLATGPPVFTAQCVTTRSHTKTRLPQTDLSTWLIQQTMSRPLSGRNTKPTPGVLVGHATRLAQRDIVDYIGFADPLGGNAQITDTVQAAGETPRTPATDGNGRTPDTGDRTSAIDGDGIPRA